MQYSARPEREVLTNRPADSLKAPKHSAKAVVHDKMTKAQHPTIHIKLFTEVTIDEKMNKDFDSELFVDRAEDNLRTLLI